MVSIAEKWETVWEKYQWHIIIGSILVLVAAGLYYIDPFGWQNPGCTTLCTVTLPPAT